MEQLLHFSIRLERVLIRIGKVAAWAGLALILVTVFDVITRRFLVLGSTKLQELEWHFHTLLFGFCMASAYLCNAHVRIDIVREGLGQRTRRWIEIAGCVLFLIPYCVLVSWFSIEFVQFSFAQQEISASATGLPFRWVIKSVLPLSFIMLGLSGLLMMVRSFVYLFGSKHLVEQVTALEKQHSRSMKPERR